MKQRLNMNAIAVAEFSGSLVPKNEPPEGDLSNLENLSPHYACVDQSSINTCSCSAISALLPPQYAKVTSKLHYLQDHNYCMKSENDVYDVNHSKATANLHILHDHKYCIRINNEVFGSNYNKENL